MKFLRRGKEYWFCRENVTIRVEDTDFGLKNKVLYYGVSML